MTYDPRFSLGALFGQGGMQQPMQQPQGGLGGALMRPGPAVPPSYWGMMAAGPGQQPRIPLQEIDRKLQEDQHPTVRPQPAPGTQSPGPGVGGSEWQNETPRNYERLLGLLRGQGMSDAAARAQAREMLRRKGLLPPGEAPPGQAQQPAAKR